MKIERDENFNPAGEACASCFFFKPLGVFEAGRANVGICRRFPPNGFPVNQGGQVGTIPVVPPVDAAGWCGEFATEDEASGVETGKLALNG